MKSKRVYVYFVGGRQGTNIVLSHKTQLWPDHHKILESAWDKIAGSSFSEHRIQLALKNFLDCYGAYRIFPIADFMPSIPGNA